MRKKRKVLLPKIAIKKMMDEAEEIAKRGFASAADIFEGWMGLIDKYRDYFYCESWPEKFDYERVTTFTQEDIDFIDENDEEYVDRVSAVLLKKSISLEGFNVNGEFAWAEQAFFKQFVNPELEIVYNHFKELVKSSASAEDIISYWRLTIRILFTGVWLNLLGMQARMICWISGFQKFWSCFMQKAVP